MDRIEARKKLMEMIFKMPERVPCHCDGIDEIEPDVWASRKIIVHGDTVEEPFIDDDRMGIRYSIMRNGQMRESTYQVWWSTGLKRN